MQVPVSHQTTWVHHGQAFRHDSRAHLKINKTMMRTLATALITLGILSGGASASVVIPIGVQQNIPISTVTGLWGWTLVYQGTYGTFDVPINTLFAGVTAGDYVMYAARPTGSATITLLAAAIESDVRTVTLGNSTTTSNGAEWYYNANSIGFAGLGNTIFQSTADTSSTNPELRLSWHTGGGVTGFGGQSNSVGPTDVDGGWRAGTTTNLNNSTAWERLVFVATPVPEPSSAILLAFGAFAIAFRRSRS
jgi:hypothetical protein